ncbi:MAG: hypothetical protein IPN15_18870 [Saprospiraceae bacterium]|nr:hypothetical protein [Candidatus Vicinibacter affinis]
MKTILFFGAIFNLFIHCGFSQVVSSEKFGFKHHSIQSKKLGDVNYYVTINKSAQQKPMLLYVDGSGSLPLFHLMERGMAGTVPFDYKKLSEHFHIVLISKPGIPFADSVRRDPEHGYPMYPEPEEYNKRLSLDWRVEAAKEVLEKVIKHYRVDRRKIAVMGISEGFQVGAKLAAECKKVTHCLLLVGNGLNQFYDFIIQNRTDAACGMISDHVAQQNIDSLQKIYQDIYTYGDATDKNGLAIPICVGAVFVSISR